MSRGSLTETIPSAVSALRDALSELEADSGPEWEVAQIEKQADRAPPPASRAADHYYYSATRPLVVAATGGGGGILCLVRPFFLCLRSTCRTDSRERTELGTQACRQVQYLEVIKRWLAPLLLCLFVARFTCVFTRRPLCACFVLWEN